MNKKDKERYKKKLLEFKEELTGKLLEAQNESKFVEEHIAQDVGDKAESSYTKEFLLSLSNTERNQLFLIDDALERLEKDDYGNCQSCGNPIGKKRLDAVPWAVNCISCQQKAEEENA
ncbi:MAG: TraR/DksA family transcriptional regulator [Candidatus Aminicenantes bacterium]|nr:TraR/DksA family transcriptional regulator [Candidatus Aminicenantes bacterium]